MAVFTAKRVNPRIENERFVVDVEVYKDGVLVKTERFETTQDQPAGWPGDGIKRLIQNLQDVPNLPAKISAGDVVIPPDVVIDAAVEAWQADYSLASRVKTLVELGVIRADNAKYVALLARLKTNFKAEYIGLV